VSAPVVIIDVAHKSPGKQYEGNSDQGRQQDGNLKGSLIAAAWPCPLGWNVSLCRSFSSRHRRNEHNMNWGQIKGEHQFKGKAREQWGNLTDDDSDRAEGNREQLAGRIQERYGIAIIRVSFSRSAPISQVPVRRLTASRHSTWPRGQDGCQPLSGGGACRHFKKITEGADASFARGGAGRSRRDAGAPDLVSESEKLQVAEKPFRRATSRRCQPARI
jgi:uncharacterized protein YjbJ (UPF0337 family)